MVRRRPVLSLALMMLVTLTGGFTVVPPGAGRRQVLLVLAAWGAGALLAALGRLSPRTSNLLLCAGVAILLIGLPGWSWPEAQRPLADALFVTLAPLLWAWLIAALGARSGLIASLVVTVLALLVVVLNPPVPVALQAHFALALPILAGMVTVARARESAPRPGPHGRPIADALTGLPDRLTFLDKLEDATRRAVADPRQAGFVLLVVDLDGFRAMDEAHGPTVGDVVLSAVAARLRSGPGTLVGRVGGDEFAVLVPRIVDAAGADRAARDVQARLGLPFEVERQQVCLSASVGACLVPGQTSSGREALANAALALEAARHDGPGRRALYEAETAARTRARRRMMHDLRAAVRHGEFELHYQPTFDLVTGRLSGTEALLRWRRPDGEQVGPDVFIPVAEAAGLIVPIGTWVLREAVRQRRAWHDANLDAGIMAVNVSAVQAADPTFPALVRSVLREAGLCASLLELELTESVVLDARAATRIRELRDLGVRVSIDDFGTGYSCLARLVDLPVSGLKIDRAFVRSLASASPRGDGNRALVRSILSLAGSLGLRVVAEGIETRGQLDVLRDGGCDAAQGYLLAPPLPAADLPSLLAEDSGLGPRSRWA